MLRSLRHPTDRDSLMLTAGISAALSDTADAVVLFEGVMLLDSILVTSKTTRKSWSALRTLTPFLLSRGNAERARSYAQVMRQIANTDSLNPTRSANVGLADLYLARSFAVQGMRDSARVWATAATTALRAGAGAAHVHTARNGGSARHASVASLDLPCGTTAAPASWGNATGLILFFRRPTRLHQQVQPDVVEALRDHLTAQTRTIPKPSVTFAMSIKPVI